MTEPFDAVAWMRQKRAAIDEQDKGLPWEEKSRKTLELLQGDPLWERIEGRIAEPPAFRPSKAAGR